MNLHSSLMKTAICAIAFFLTCLTLRAQEELMELDGAIQIGNSQDPTPDNGTIRWNGSDFEGKTSRGWKSLTASSSNTNSTLPNTVMDIENNVYRTVKIGTQTWMREDLRTSTYTDGTPIDEKVSETEWITPTPGWCWHQNNPKHDEKYGKIYNWYAVDIISSNGKKVCPTGWHVPSKQEFEVLDAFLDFPGSHISTYRKLKEIGSDNWNDNTTLGTNGTNDSGFTGIPSPGRLPFGNFHGRIGNYVKYWTVTEYDVDQAYLFKLSTDFISDENVKTEGGSVRCLKD